MHINANVIRTELYGKGAWNVQPVGAVVWPVQVASVHDELEDLLVGQALVRLLGQRADLPQNHPKRPGGQKESEGGPVLNLPR